MEPADARWRVWCLYEGAWWGRKTKIVMISSAWIRPKWAYKQQTHIFPTYVASPKEALVRQESEPMRQRNDRSEQKGSSKEALSDLFSTSQKWFLLVQNASSRFWKLCFLLGQGAHFGKNREKWWPKSEKCTPETLDGECGAYMCGLGGAKKRKCLFRIGFKGIFEGVKGATRNLRPAARSWAEPFWGHFGATFASLWVYSGDFGLLSDCFGIIVESLGYIKADFKKTFIFTIDLNDFIKKWLLWGRFGVTLG